MKKKFSKKFKQLIDFINFTHEFRDVIRLEDVLENKNKKIAVSLDIDKYWQELLKEMIKNKKIYFKK